MRPIPPLVLLLAIATPLTGGCSTAPKLPEACAVKPESGRCRAAFTRYWFDDKAASCLAFIWGGCAGSVPFETLELCHAQCMPGQPLPTIPGGKTAIPAAGAAPTTKETAPCAPTPEKAT